MNNSNDWYTEGEAMMLLDLKKDKLRSTCKNVDQMRLANRRLYRRDGVNEILRDIVSEEVLQIALKQVKNYNIDFDVFIPMKNALETLGLSRQRLYQLKNSGKIEAVNYNGRMLFSKVSMFEHKENSH